MVNAQTRYLYNQSIVGTCSLCKGAVTVPTIWHGIYPPTPTCSSCGAVAAPNYGPEIQMVPATPTVTTNKFELYPKPEDIKFKYEINKNYCRSDGINWAWSSVVGGSDNPATCVGLRKENYYNEN